MKSYNMLLFVLVLIILYSGSLYCQDNLSNSGTNVCLSSNGGKVSAISEGIYLGHKQNAYYANDGDPNTSWSSEWDMPAWLEIEFNSPYNINSIGIWWASHKHKFRISLSLDGSSWTTVLDNEVSNNYEGSSPTHELFSIQETRAKYIRINIVGTSAPSSHIFQASVAELEAFANRAYQRHISSNFERNVSLASNGGVASAVSEGVYMGQKQYEYYANDGDPNTSWSSQWDMPAWLEIKFDKEYFIGKIGVCWATHQHEFSISLSRDGFTWTTVITSRISNNYEGSRPMHEFFQIPRTLAKFIKIYITNTSAPRSHIFQASVGELEAYEE